MWQMPKKESLNVNKLNYSTRKRRMRTLKESCDDVSRSYRKRNHYFGKTQDQRGSTSMIKAATVYNEV